MNINNNGGFIPLEIAANFREENSLTGFTLSELALVIAIFAVVACGILGLFISSSTLTESVCNTTVMVNRAIYELENIVLRGNFDTLVSYSLLPPSIPNNTSLVCYVQNHNSTFCPDPVPEPVNVKEIRIVMSYKEKGNRIIGEDRNFNGTLDGGEDINGDGRLSSPCEIATFITRE